MFCFWPFVGFRESFYFFGWGFPDSSQLQPGHGQRLPQTTMALLKTVRCWRSTGDPMVIAGSRELLLRSIPWPHRQLFALFDAGAERLTHFVAGSYCPHENGFKEQTVSQFWKLCKAVVA